MLVYIGNTPPTMIFENEQHIINEPQFVWKLQPKVVSQNFALFDSGNMKIGNSDFGIGEKKLCTRFSIIKFKLPTQRKTLFQRKLLPNFLELHPQLFTGLN